MPSTTSYRQGDIILVFFPFTDLTSSKRHPALVISPDFFSSQCLKSRGRRGGLLRSLGAK